MGSVLGAKHLKGLGCQHLLSSRVVRALKHQALPRHDVTAATCRRVSDTQRLVTPRRARRSHSRKNMGRPKKYSTPEEEEAQRKRHRVAAREDMRQLRFNSEYRAEANAPRRSEEREIPSTALVM